MRSARWILPGLCLAILFFTSSAFAQDVSYNFDSKADFSKYKSYRWEKHPQSVDIDEITMNQLGESLDRELAKKGLTKTAAPTADLVIVYQLAIKNEKELTTYSTGFSTGPYWGGGWYGAGGGYSTTSVNTLTIGTLGLDIYDPTTKTLIWRGVATKTLDTGAKPGKRQRNIDKATAKLLKNFPPPMKNKK
jgi:uncharacterized protein DUF4136